MAFGDIEEELDEGVSCVRGKYGRRVGNGEAQCESGTLFSTCADIFPNLLSLIRGSGMLLTLPSSPILCLGLLPRR